MAFKQNSKYRKQIHRQSLDTQLHAQESKRDLDVQEVQQDSREMQQKIKDFRQYIRDKHMRQVQQQRMLADSYSNKMHEEEVARISEMPRREDSQEALKQALIYEKEQMQMKSTKKDLVRVIKGINRHQMEQSRKQELNRVVEDHQRDELTLQEQQRPFDLAQERYQKAIEKSLERIERTYDSTMKSSIKTFSVAEDIKLRDQA